MLFTTALLSLLSLGSLAAAAPASEPVPLPTPIGSAKVVNKCPFPVTLWSVGSTVGPAQTLAAGTGTYAEVYSRDAVTGGRALKLTRQPDGLFNGDAQTVFAYNYEPEPKRIWYDLSTVFGNTFDGHKLAIKSSKKPTNCAPIVWNSGTPPAGSQVRNCESHNTLVFTLCAA